MVKTYLDSIINSTESPLSYDPEVENTYTNIISSLAPVLEENHQLIYKGVLERLIEQNDLHEIFTPKADNGFAITHKLSGHGLVYFMQEMLADKYITLAGKTAIVSGSDPLALHTMTKLHELKVKILGCSDDAGVIHDPYGIDLSLIKRIKSDQTTSLEHYLLSYPDAIYIKNPSVIWHIPCQIALACSPEIALTNNDVIKLVEGGCIALVEGNDLSTSSKNIQYLINNNVLYSPFKATDLTSITSSEASILTDYKLESIMKKTYTTCKTLANKYGYRDHLSIGANIARFEQASRLLIN